MYLNYKDFSVDFDVEKLTFRAFYASDRDGVERCFIDNGVITFTALDGKPLSLDDFGQKSVSTSLHLSSSKLTLMLSDGPVSTPELEISFTAGQHSLGIKGFGRSFVTFSGDFCWGDDMENSTRSIRTGTQTPILHTACGPAVSPEDDALFDVKRDALLRWSTAGNMSVKFDWSKKCYSFRHVNGLDHGKDFSFAVRRNYCAEKFNIPYAPMSEKHQFQTPPVGWMTWYALNFSCCRDKVLDNAEKFMRTFGKYNDKPVIWVDWEWCHKCFDGQGEPGADIFNPRQSAYPDGLAEISAKIRSLGAVPALWIGATNEGVINDMLKAHPEWILGQKAIWCGQYWVDLSNPEVLDKYIRKIFEQILDWGFEVVKWDCLPATLEMLSLFHSNQYDTALSPHQALRNAVKTARSVLGDGRYLLSCSGSSWRDTAFAVDLFDAARIGGDIFTWQEFQDQAVNQVLQYYFLHNQVYYADADNLVLRKEFNDLRQVRSRVSFYGLAGLPVTLGDEMDELDKERVDMLKKIMPTSSMHASEFEIKQRDNRYQVVNAAVARPFGCWNVAGVTNFGEEKSNFRIRLGADLMLDPAKRYALYDFWQDEYLGVSSSSFELEIDSCDTRVIRVVPLEERDLQLLSSNRHILQGAVELEELIYDANCVRGCVRCPEKEEVVLTFLVREGVTDVKSSFPVDVCGDICKITVSGNGKTEFYLEYTAVTEEK